MGKSTWNEQDLEVTLKKKGVAIQSAFGKGLKSQFVSQIDGKGKTLDVEPSSGCKSLGQKVLAIRTTGTCVIRFKAFRKRLADSDGNCFKYIGDAIQRSGAVVDDSARYVLYITEPQEKVQREEDERVEVTIEYESVDLDDLWVDLAKENE